MPPFDASHSGNRMRYDRGTLPIEEDSYSAMVDTIRGPTCASNSTKLVMPPQAAATSTTAFSPIFRICPLFLWWDIPVSARKSGASNRA